MKRKDQIIQLISEMASYLLEENPMRLVLSLHQEEDGLHLAVLDDNLHSDEEIHELTRKLNSRKRPELAGYYGAMTGHDLLGSARLDLLGWNIKHADVAKLDHGVKIDLWIGGDRFDSRQFNIPDKE